MIKAFSINFGAFLGIRLDLSAAESALMRNLCFDNSGSTRKELVY